MNMNDICVRIDFQNITLNYWNGPVESAFWRESGEITIQMRDGRQYKHLLPEKLVSQKYGITNSDIAQYGICFTEDAKYFFISSWYKGLLCFDLQNGQLQWSTKLHKAAHMIVDGDTVLCRFWGVAIEKIRISTGETICRYPFSAEGGRCLPLAKDQFFVGPKRGQFVILNKNLEEERTIPYSELNPNGYRLFIILQVQRTKTGLLIKGYENADSFGSGDAENDLFYRQIAVT